MPESISLVVTYKLEEIAAAFLDAKPMDPSTTSEDECIAGYRHEIADALERCRELKDMMPNKEKLIGPLATSASVLVDHTIKELAAAQRNQRNLNSAAEYHSFLEATLSPLRTEALKRDTETKLPDGPTAFYFDVNLPHTPRIRPR